MRYQKGFTLIELVVVIVILGILGLISIPKYLDISDEAKNNTYRGQLSTFESAIRTFYAEKALQGTPRFPQSDGEIRTLFSDGKIPTDPYSDWPDNEGRVLVVAWDSTTMAYYMEVLAGYEAIYYYWIVSSLTGDVHLVHPDESIYAL